MLRFIVLSIVISVNCGLISYYITKNIPLPKTSKVPIKGHALLSNKAKDIFENNFVDVSKYENKGQEKLDNFVYSDSDFTSLESEVESTNWDDNINLIYYGE